MLNSLGYVIAATCVLKMPLNPNHPSIHLTMSTWPVLLLLIMLLLYYICASVYVFVLYSVVVFILVSCTDIIVILCV